MPAQPLSARYLHRSCTPSETDTSTAAFSQVPTRKLRTIRLQPWSIAQTYVRKFYTCHHSRSQPNTCSEAAHHPKPALEYLHGCKTVLKSCTCRHDRSQPDTYTEAARDQLPALEHRTRENLPWSNADAIKPLSDGYLSTNSAANIYVHRSVHVHLCACHALVCLSHICAHIYEYKHVSDRAHLQRCMWTPLR